MKPAHEILSRIRWDRDFGAAEFEIGYYDRLQDRIVRVPFRELHFDPTDHFAFRVADEQGEVHSVPFHRVREISRNGELIWRR